MATTTSNKLLTFSLIIFSYIVVGICRDLHGQQIGDTPLTSMPCIQKLIPCQPYLAITQSLSPPDSCCSPLKELIESPGETKCLCSILANPTFMSTFNVTKNGAYKLARACGSSVSESLCVTVPSPTDPKTPCEPMPPFDGSSPTTTRPPKKNAATGTPRSDGFRNIIFGVLLLLSVSGHF